MNEYLLLDSEGIVCAVTRADSEAEALPELISQAYWIDCPGEVAAIPEGYRVKVVREPDHCSFTV